MGTATDIRLFWQRSRAQASRNRGARHLSSFPPPALDSDMDKSTINELLAGSVGGAAQVIVGQPLDTVKTRAQTAPSSSMFARSSRGSYTDNFGAGAFRWHVCSYF